MPSCPVGKLLSDIAPFDAASDATPLAALHAACFATAWDAAAITALLGTPGTFAFHHKDGFVLARTAADEAEILTLAVAPQARAQASSSFMAGPPCPDGY